MSNNISYVLDTNVIIDDHEIFTKLIGENIIIPLVVLEELDKLKQKEGRLGEAARRANRSLEKLRILGTKQGTNLLRGIKIEETGTIIKIWGAERKTQVPPGMGSSNDNDIIMVAYEFKKEFKKDVILVSNDINVRVKCDALGVKTEKYDLTTTTNRLVTGIADPTQLPKKKLDELFSAGSVKVEAAYRGLDYESVADNLHLNQYGLITAYEQNGGSALVKYIKNEEDEWVAKTIKSKTAFGIKPKNAEQRFLMDALLDPNIQLVTVSGLPGSGKTFLAIAAALEQVQAQIFKKDQEIDFTVSKYQRKKKLKKQELATNAMYDEEDIEYSRMKYGVGGVVEKTPTKYNKIIVTKSIVPVGKDIGFLPGPQPLDAKIVTPSGWTTMGELKIGDYVISRDGSPAEILGIYPKGTKDVFKITTADGTSTESCEDHLWFTKTREEIKRGKEGKIRTTKEIIETLYDKNGKPNHFLPRNEAVQYSGSEELSIPAYTLGVLLGDGSIGNGGNGHISFASKDLELVKKVEAQIESMGCKLNYPTKNRIGYGIFSKDKLAYSKTARPVLITNILTGEKKKYNRIGEVIKDFQNIKRGTLNSRCKEKRIIDNIKFEFMEVERRWQNPIKNELHKLGLIGHRAWEKFIPESYKFAKIEDRIELLRGLMDTDGTIKKNGEASYTTTSLRLANDIIELARSLGGRATICKRDRIGKQSKAYGTIITTKRESYEFTISLPENINPFFISRKSLRHRCAYMHKPAIMSIEKIEQKEVQCILIDHPEHLYLTNDFIVTHNTKQEKLGPWLQPIWDNLEQIVGSKETIEMMTDEYTGIIEMEATAHVRGRSIANSIMIIDEAQNMSVHEIKTLLTRMAEGSKIILTGDINQIDSYNLDRYNNGLSVVAEKFKDKPYSAHITLTEGHRLPLVQDANDLL